MGRDLNGKEIGKGLVQEPNGLYKARYFHNSHVTSKRFKYLNDARRWLVDKSYEADHGISVNEYTTTFDEWFGYWLETVKGSNISYRTRTDYQALYDLHIKDYIGDFLVSEIKPVHCLNVLVSMEKKGLANSYIQKARVIMHDSFESAFDNDLIRKNPITKKVSAKGGQPKEKFIMDRKQEEMFLEYAKDYYYYPVFAFILQTGLRISELMGLKWSDVDLNTQTMNIERSVEFRKDLQKFAEKPPKSKAGYRQIPLSEKAMGLLAIQKDLNINAGAGVRPQDYVFLNTVGKTSHKSDYNRALRAIFKKMDVQPVSIHCLRHTFATRCIEAGIRPKTVQKLLGHSTLTLTMDLYVHVTDMEMHNEFKKLEALSI